MVNKIQTTLASLICLWALLLGPGANALADTPTVNFGLPPWPGVSIKTEVVAQVLQALGYHTKTLSLGTPFVYRGLASGKVDAFLATWLPAQQNMLKPLLKKHQVVKLTQNLSGAIEGLAVPDYVWKSGIHSVKDLADHAARFDHKIYGIEAGSAINGKVKTAIKHNYEGLGGWKLVASSTAAMLTQVKRAAQRKQPIVFIAWRPHWMNIKFNIRYLKDKGGSAIAGIKSKVYTLVSAQLPERDPNLTKFLRQFHIGAATQSHWIYQYSYKKQSKAKVARTWLSQHPKIVQQWLKGVQTADGASAMAAYRRAFNIE